MAFTPRSDEQREQAITRLVDDSLSARERDDVEQWAAGQPDVSRQVSLQRQVADALRSSGPPVPPGLVDHVTARVRAERPTARPRVGVMSGWRPIAAAAFAAVAAIVVVVAITTSGGGGSPSIEAAARLANAPATQSAPAARTSTLLDVSYGGVTYPNYRGQFAAVPTGQRIDSIGGRPALTVFYRLHNGARLSYTVFSGKPVPLPAGVQTVVFDGVPLHVFSTSPGLSVVTLVRFGRTCVLAAPVSHQAVLALAAAPVHNQAA
jgi:hypothetical protein